MLVLYDEFDLIVSESTVSRALKKLHWSQKQAVRVAKHRNQFRRDEWMTRLAGWRADQLVFLDESAACERTGMFALSPVILQVCQLYFFVSD